MTSSFDPSDLKASHLTAKGISRRKALLDFTDEDAQRLREFQPEAAAFYKAAIEEFFDQQMSIPEMRTLVEEPGIQAALRETLHRYVPALFSGIYDEDYADDRLNIGVDHTYSSVSHILFVPLLHRLELVLGQYCRDHGAGSDLLASLHKLVLFDLQLILDSYTAGMIRELEASRSRLAHHAETLEEKVAERTAEILHMARTDPLTGLWNRREFYQRLRHEAVSARRGQHNLSIVFLDINEFKEVNDTRGHPFGDKMLRQVGTAVNEITRETDLAFRFGGDEFCLILPFTDAAGAEKLCSILQAGMPDGVTISCGVAQMQPDDEGTFEMLVTRADSMMYAAKAAYQAASDSA